MFSDQGLEQWIKELKGVVVGITQEEEVLNRFIITAPYLTKMVNHWRNEFPQSVPKGKSERYQLAGDIAMRSTSNALKLRDGILLHCEGNPFINLTPLKNIVSSILKPEGSAKNDILDADRKGNQAFQKFIEDRMLTNSPLSIWDPMQKLKLKTFSTWMKKTRVAVGDKVIKLREERQLLARFLVIQQSRPEFVPKLASTIGEYELAVIPRSLFTQNGSLMLPNDKAGFMHAIESAAMPDAETQDSVSDNTPADTAGTGNDQEEPHVPQIPLPGFEPPKVIIIDAMAAVQCLRKVPTMKKILDLKQAFVKRIQRIVSSYSEARVIFDRYDVTQSL